MANIALVDDHPMFRNGLASLLQECGHDVVLEADNGHEFLQLINQQPLPDIVLLDINMPIMDGYETALWLRKQHSEIKVLALSMFDEEMAIVRMLRSGARGYILKGYGKSELKSAIQSVITKGFYYNDLVTGPLLRSILDENDAERLMLLNKAEITFLKYICTEMTYKEIADKMCLSARTIDGYREELFKKLGAKSRVGLVMYAIKNRIVTV